MDTIIPMVIIQAHIGVDTMIIILHLITEVITVDITTPGIIHIIIQAIQGMTDIITVVYQTDLVTAIAME
jgi:hypothetical protein